MAYTRKRVGSIYMSKKEEQSDYLVFRLPVGESLVFRDGDKIQVESKRYRLDSLERGLNEGRLTPEKYEELKGYADNMPEFVRAELVLLKKSE